MGFLINDEKKSEIIKSSEDLEISRTINDIYLSKYNNEEKKDNNVLSSIHNFNNNIDDNVLSKNKFKNNDGHITSYGNNLNSYENDKINNDINKVNSDINKIKNALTDQNYVVETGSEDAGKIENKNNDLLYNGNVEDKLNCIINDNNINMNEHENDSGDINIPNNFIFDKKNENIYYNNTSSTINNSNMETKKDSNRNEYGNLLVNSKLNGIDPNSINGNTVINKKFNKNMKIFRATPYNTNQYVHSIKKKIKKKFTENDYLFCTINKFLRDGLKNECIPLFERLQQNLFFLVTLANASHRSFDEHEDSSSDY
ncbi:conserved Plasmodium protein, unknown function [Plasmodium berghei]|uniref:Uncharacterized protein n=2 Tax=Plasmodium berghei TaxID=5821 RepID=A0A509AP16_PLABA|nr:conserved Plasmodium protein, unknown function [Plasmodium berghei ANKA]CXJ00035.1 conserved Plasmodium protein, unknown function [Plasmodium berghei]SCL97950.1 conserved Plasmodium protein, unknown function [Plasmodium berghei]SCM16719.1 conserved Plasmodium protein, unknown function [Plasmodium berghei]SCM18517.1 conserved Plasmodium protein, unknown function [Plasmodium berghei]SCN27950.1 conserved Plasmodium protein, unknown function [Plasmodium berghei]|eukprot:XP_034423603.1 conserved Plasmodium protein, unknown function [Plasmodium berghei ANKA]